MPDKILIVDKSNTFAPLIKDILNGFLIITARDNADAMRKMEETADIAVVILASVRPESDHLNMLRYMSEDKKNVDILAIIISDSIESEDELKCLVLGAHDYIKMPANPHVIKQRIENHFKIIEKQKLLEQKYNNLESIYQSIFQQSTIGIAISLNSESFTDGREHLVAMNAKFEQICGRTSDELLELGWADITHPDDLEEDLKMFRKLQSGEISSYSMDKRYLKPDGSIVWVHMIVATLVIINENKYNHICLVQDITQQKAMLLRIEKDQHMSQAFLNSCSDIIFLKDEKLCHIFANQALADFLGVDVNNIVGKTDIDIMDADSAAYCHNTDLETLDKREVLTFLREVNNKVFEIRKFPVPLGEGKIGVGAYIRDITKEHRQQELINKIAETNRIITECMLKPFIDMQEQLDFALHEAIRLTESQYGYIYFYDENAKEFILNSWTNGVMDDCSVIKKQTKYQLDKTGIWGEVVRQRKPVIVNDFDAPNPLKKGYPEGHVVIHKYMSIPIFENDHIVAVIGFANRASDYTDNDVYSMTVLMSGVWIATKKRAKETETETLLARTQSMFDHHEAIMLLLEPYSGKIIEANSAATSFYGYSKEELLNMAIQDLNILGKDKVSKLRLEALNKGQKYFTFPHRLKNGEIKSVDVYSSPIEFNGNKVLFSIIFDVTRREEAKKQIEYLAYHDYLTGLYNKRFFEDEFARRKSDPEKYPNAVLMGDVNGLKIYNDTFGHQGGDRALIDIAKRLKSAIKNDDILARIGGDEFVIIASATTEKEIRRYLEAIDQEVNAVDEDKAEKHLTISFGYGIQRKATDSLDDLLKEAEAFMYNRKYYSNKSARSNTVNVIMETLFTKNAREKKHSERVGLICEAIATKMNLDKQSVDKARVAGFLHDIGKIGIDESILNKVGKLDKNEWETMKLHSAKGAGILENINEFKEISEIVLSHHERLNGSGYPNGLKGKEIPLIAKIIAVADSYDAMTNDRSYRNKISSEEAARELDKGSGVLYDPEVVSVFIDEVLPDESVFVA